LPTREIASSGMDIREDNEAFALGPSISEIPFLPLESFASLFS